MPTSDDNVHTGHRARMLEKFEKHGARVFDSYELLEMLLYRVIPYRDTNPVAHRLFDAFGSLDGIFCADEKSLCAVSGIGERAARFLRDVGESGLSAQAFFEDPVVFNDYTRAGEYFSGLLSPLETPRTLMLMLDNRMAYLGLVTVAELDLASAGVRDRMFIEPAIRAGASFIMVAHNHPFGAPFPTEGDRMTSKMLSDSLTAAGLRLAADYVVSGNAFHNVPVGNFAFSQSDTVFLRFLDSIPKEERE